MGRAYRRLAAQTLTGRCRFGRQARAVYIFVYAPAECYGGIARAYVSRPAIRVRRAARKGRLTALPPAAMIIFTARQCREGEDKKIFGGAGRQI